MPENFTQFIPKKIKVIGNVIPVVFDTEVTVDSGDCVYGKVDTTKDRIVICRDYSQWRQLETFVHELVEVVNISGPFFASHANLNAFSSILSKALVDSRLCFDSAHYRKPRPRKAAK